MHVEVSAAVRPTEDAALVEEAVLRFLPGAAVERHADRVMAVGSELRPLRSRVWELRIIDAFRARLLHGAAPDGKSVAFSLSKQGALAGKVSLPPRPHVLGDLEWRIELDASEIPATAEALAFWMCPETQDGEIVGPIIP